MKKQTDINFEYIPEDPLEVLKNYEEKNCFREVLYTFGNQEIVKEDGKFYLAHTIYPSESKEISREIATEMWQTYNMKERSDVSIGFEENNPYRRFRLN